MGDASLQELLVDWGPLLLSAALPMFSLLLVMVALPMVALPPWGQRHATDRAQREDSAKDRREVSAKGRREGGAKGGGARRKGAK